MASIFISSRRDDSSGLAGRLEGDLSAYFGVEQVFHDREIPPGADFASHLNARIEDAEIVLVVIGREWLDATDSEGLRRLDHPGDWVRREIEEAMRLRRIVVPVLVEGAAMPWPDQLPDSLAMLAGRQAVSLNDLRWQRDVDALAEQLASRSPTLAAAHERHQPHAERKVVEPPSDSEDAALRAAPTPRQRGLVAALGCWLANRLGKLFSLSVFLLVTYLLVRAVGGPQANRMLDQVVTTTVAQLEAIF